jgi:hypothetical protein
MVKLLLSVAILIVHAGVVANGQSDAGTLLLNSASQHRGIFSMRII